MRLQARGHRRKGMSMVEAVLATTALLTLCLGTIDLGMAVFRQHALTEAARQGARQAVVHGSLAKSPWGTATYSAAANDTDAKAQAIAPYLVGMDPSAVTVTMTWPDGSNASEKNVRVKLDYTWTPLLSFIFNQSVPLTASSQMQIAH